MCFELLHYCLTRLTTPSAVSYFNITNWYSAEINNHLAKTQIHSSISGFNPTNIVDEMEILQSPLSGNAIQRNYRFLARRMLNRLDLLQVFQYFKDKPKINILSIGCGYAFDFIPLNVYFTYHNSQITYTGIDCNDQVINAASTTFSQFDNATFIHGDIRHYTSDRRYDLIIIQHPDFLNNAALFENIFRSKVLPLLATEGHIYTSFYYETEWQEFKSKILPDWKPVLGALELQRPELGSLVDRHNRQTYAPEKFVYFSPIPYVGTLPQSLLAQDKENPSHLRARFRKS